MKKFYLRKYGTKRQREASIIMMQKPIEIDAQTFYPIQGIPIHSQPEAILGCMVVYGEGRGEPDEGQKAIAQVIANRYISQKKYFGVSLREVLLDKTPRGSYEFSCLNESDPNLRKMFNPDMQSWFVVARNCLSYFIRPVAELNDPILYYHSVAIPAGTFFQRLRFVKQIGKHRFYSE